VFGGGGRRGGCGSGCLFWILVSVGLTIFINLIPPDLPSGLGSGSRGQRLARAGISPSPSSGRQNGPKCVGGLHIKGDHTPAATRHH
jgi:hypothetical protein